MGECNTRERVRESSLATNLVFSRVCEEFEFSLKKKGVLKALFVLSIITVVISLLPLMYGLNYYTLVGAFITVTLVIESILAKIQQK